MKLTDYLEAEKVSATALAAKLGVSVSTVTRAAKGEVIPQPELMAKLYKVTGGKVQPNDFYGLAA